MGGNNSSNRRPRRWPFRAALLPLKRPRVRGCRRQCRNLVRLLHGLSGCKPPKCGSVPGCRTRVPNAATSVRTSPTLDRLVGHPANGLARGGPVTKGPPWRGLQDDISARRRALNNHSCAPEAPCMGSELTDQEKRNRSLSLGPRQPLELRRGMQVSRPNTSRPGEVLQQK
jgi:hypothetical protein